MSTLRRIALLSLVAVAGLTLPTAAYAGHPHSRNYGHGGHGGNGAHGGYGYGRGYAYGPGYGYAAPRYHAHGGYPYGYGYGYGYGNYAYGYGNGPGCYRSYRPAPYYGGAYYYAPPRPVFGLYLGF
jgi:hypothetical protein